MAVHLALLFAIAAVGGLLPLLGGRSHRALHLFVSLAAGLFLGVVFLHLLPRVAELSVAATASAGQAHGHTHAFEGLYLWAFVLGGALGLFLLQNVFLAGGSGDDRSQHRTVSWASLFGLCVHAFTDGLGLSAFASDPEHALPLLATVGLHKLGEGFSLATVFLLAGFSRARVIGVTLGFALVTPLGLGAGTWLVERLSPRSVNALTATAAGTFLFVALCDLLPEVFHGSRDRGAKVLLVVVGIVLSFAFDTLLAG